MNDIMTTVGSLTMTSREIAEMTGKRHDHVKRDIEKMLNDLGLDTPSFGGTYTDSQNRQQTEYRLPKDETLCLVAGYDVKARMKIIKRWQELEQAPKVPTIKDPQLAAMVTMLTQLDAVKQEQSRQAVEIENIKAKMIATDDQFYTVAGYASLRGISIDQAKANTYGRKCAALSRKNGLDIGKAHSAIHGTVNTYHVDVLFEVFATNHKTN